MNMHLKDEKVDNRLLKYPTFSKVVVICFVDYSFLLLDHRVFQVKNFITSIFSLNA